jgi:hypothetical protein
VTLERDVQLIPRRLAAEHEVVQPAEQAQR